MLFRKRTCAFRSPRMEPTLEPVAIRFLDDPPPAAPPKAPPAPPAPPAAAAPPKRKREFPITTLAFLAVLGAGVVIHGKGGLRHAQVGAEEEMVRTFAVNEGKLPRVVVEMLNGPIEVTRGEAGRVECRVTRRSTGQDRPDAETDLKNLSVSMAREGDTITITARRIAGLPRQDAGTSARIRVPEGTSVRVVSSNGPLKVEGVEGPVDARTTNGPIEVKAASGRLSLASSNGPIHVEATDAVVLADGSNGSIDFEGTLASGASSFHTSNGKVTLKLPADLAFHVDAKTSNGKISSDFGLSPSRGAKGRALVGSVGNDPKVRLKVRTSNGGIRLVEEDD